MYFIYSITYSRYCYSLLTLLDSSGHNCSSVTPYLQKCVEIILRDPPLPAETMRNEFAALDPATDRFLRDPTVVGNIRNGEKDGGLRRATRFHGHAFVLVCLRLRAATRHPPWRRPASPPRKCRPRTRRIREPLGAPASVRARSGRPRHHHPVAQRHRHSVSVARGWRWPWRFVPR